MTGKFRNELLVCAALIALGFGDAAAASATYSISGDWNSSVFKYGRGTGGFSFTQVAAHSACSPQLDCYDLTGQGAVLKNTSATDFNAGTVHFPAGNVVFHPIFGLGDTDAIIRFVAPIAALWQVSGQFWRDDTTASGNGTSLSIFTDVANVPSLISTNFVAPNSYGLSSSFTSFSVALNAGDWVEFALNNIGGNHNYDSTGIDATFTASVPEPATWALLIVGFGLVGTMARRRAERTHIA